jgi:transcriptional regulator with XRE-family HTH domain
VKNPLATEESFLRKADVTGIDHGAGGGSASADDALAVLIQERLKTLRTRAGLSLDKLSKAAGVSRGMLSQIELGRSVPSITVLSRIAVAFDVPVSTFLAPQADVRVHVLRHNETQELRSPDGKYGSRALFPFVGERRTEFFELRLEPDCVQESAAHATGTTENLVVSQGNMVVEVAGAQSELTAGDSIYFVADVPHSYRNSGTASALAYLVMSYPQPVNY